MVGAQGDRGDGDWEKEQVYRVYITDTSPLASDRLAATLPPTGNLR